MCKNEVGKRSLRTDVCKLSVVLWVGLDTKAYCGVCVCVCMYMRTLAAP